MRYISVIDANDQLIEVDLDDWVGYIGLSWNEAGQSWTLSVRNLDGDYLVSGVAVHPHWPLLRQVRRSTFPAGELAVDSLQPRLNRRSFAEGYAGLWYLDPDDLADAAELARRALAPPIREGVSVAAPRTFGNAPAGYVGPPPGEEPPLFLTLDDFTVLTDDNLQPLEL